MKTKRTTRFLSLLLTVIMLVSFVPVGVFTLNASAYSASDSTTLRNKIISDFNKMATVKWTAGATFNVKVGKGSQTYYKNQVYYGLPYAQNYGTKPLKLSTFQNELKNNNNKINKYIGWSDCCTSLGVAYKNNVSIQELWSVSCFMNKNYGFVQKGSRGNYSSLLPGDVLANGCHVMLVVAVDENNKKVKVTHQSSGYFCYSPSSNTTGNKSNYAMNKRNCSWGVNQWKSYKVLSDGNYKGYRFNKFTDTKESYYKPSTPKIKTSSPKDIALNSPVTINWSKTTNTTGYRVYLNGKEVKKTTSTSYSFKATNAQTYNLTVQAYNSSYKSNQSNKISITAHNKLKLLFKKVVQYFTRSGVEEQYLTDSPIEVNYGEDAVAPEVPVREGYTFVGWDKSLNNITEDTVFTPLYKINTYTVKFFDSKGNVLSSQKVEYGSSAAAPENTDPEAGYTFLGWSTEDYTCVKEDLNVYGVYNWANEDLPILLRNVSATRQEDGYYVYFDLQNYNKAITRGRAVVSLKTAEGKLIDTTESAAFSLPINGTKNGMEVFVPSEEVATVAEVIIVNSYHDGVPISEKKTSDISLTDNMKTAWSETAPSGTVEGLEEKTEYRYRDKEFTSSSSSTMDGWEPVPNNACTESWSDYGAWSNWSTTKVTASDSRQVESQSVKVSDAYDQILLFYFRYYNTYYKKYYYTYSKSWLTNNGYSYTKYTKWVNVSDVKSTGNSYGTNGAFKGYVKKSGYYNFSNEIWYYESTCASDKRTIAAKYETQYRYRDRSKVYTYNYYRWKDWSDWTDNELTETTDRERQPRTLYRWIDHSTTENTDGVTRTVSGNLGASFAGKQATLLIYKVDEASDFTNEFVGQQTIAQDGSYSFTFKLREEPTAKTGDFTVAIGIEGTNNTMVIDTIPAPKPQYNVTFFSDGVRLGDTQLVEKGSAAVPPANPTKEGYTFVGWSTDISNIQGDVEVQANFIQNKYTVVFVDWVKETVNVREYYHGDVINSAGFDNPEGYTFAGWEELEGLDAVVTQNMVLTAKYDKQQFDVVFYDFEGNEISRQSVGYKDAAQLPDDPVEGDMLFVGWDSEDDIYEITCDTYAYAQFVYEETVIPPSADITTNEFSTAQTVTLSCETENASIFYTLDGTDPSAVIEEGLDSVIAYTGPITISKSCQLKFVAVADEMNNSEVVTETYVISNGSMESPLMLYSELPEYVTENPSRYNVFPEDGYRYKDVTVTTSVSEAEQLVNNGWILENETPDEIWSEWSMTEPIIDGQFIEVESRNPDPIDTPFYCYNHWKYYDDETQAYKFSDVEIEGVTGEWETVELESPLSVSSFDNGKQVYSYNGETWFNRSIVTKPVTPDYLIYRYRTIQKSYYKWTDWMLDAPAQGETRQYESDTVYRYTVPASHLVTVHNNSEYVEGDSTEYLIVFENEKVSLNTDDYTIEGFTLSGFYSDDEYSNAWDFDNDVVTAKLDLYPKYEQITNTVVFKDENGNTLSEQQIVYGEDAKAPDYSPQEGFMFIRWDTAFNNVTQDITVNAVVKPVDEVITVALNKYKCTIFADSMLQLTATVSPEDAEDKTLVWKSDNEDVATVDEKGLVTALSAGTATITATTVDGITSSCLVSVKGVDNIESITFTSNEVYVSRYGTKQLEYTIAPLTANNEVVWTSTNPTIASVDENGLVTGNMAGTAVIIVSSTDGSKKDYCLVKVVGLNVESTANIDFDSGIISGLSANLDSLDEYISLTDSSCELVYDSLGTDSIVYLTREDEVIDAYTVVVFGDVNGDGWYDGTDAVIVSCLANGLLTKESVGEAVFLAADCDHDGAVTSADVAILEQAGLLLANVDQTKPKEELLQTASYIEYMNLIDQNPTADDEATEEPSVDQPTEKTFLQRIVEFFKLIVELIRSLIVK